MDGVWTNSEVVAIVGSFIRSVGKLAPTCIEIRNIADYEKGRQQAIFDSMGILERNIAMQARVWERDWRCRISASEAVEYAKAIPRVLELEKCRTAAGERPLLFTLGFVRNYHANPPNEAKISAFDNLPDLPSPISNVAEVALDPIRLRNFL